MKTTTFVLAATLLLGVAANAPACAAAETTPHPASASSATTGAGGTGGAGASGMGGLFGGGAGPGNIGPQTCEQSLAESSYIGCEYWPTVTLNGLLNPSFHFAVTVANSTAHDAVVEVDRDGTQVAVVTIAPGGLEAILLPWVKELKQEDGIDGAKVHSALVKGGAYHLVSSRPVTVVQFNPLEFQLSGEPLCNPCNSYTNDGAILLPTSALRKDYYALAQPTLHYQYPNGTEAGGWRNIPGFLAVTATADGTMVTVDSTSYVRAGDGVVAIGPGESPTYALDQGDVLLLASGSPPDGPTPSLGKPCVDSGGGGVLCPTAASYDLTGSHVVADKPVSVLAGHDCTFIPYDTPACDHIEESMLPTDTLGRDVVVTTPRTPGGEDALPTYVRVLSASDANEIAFDPPVVDPLHLDAGQWRELGPFVEPVAIHATGRIAVAQYMPGAEIPAVANDPGNVDRSGDPSESIVVPVQQYRTAYTFLSSPTFTTNFVDVIAPKGATIMLDGEPLPTADPQPVGDSTYVTTAHQLDGAVHTMTGDTKFGIVVYGYGSFTSYMLPGGMDLAPIDIPK